MNPNVVISAATLVAPVHLKTLSLVGFKSFADRTRLVFEPGVTVVVGPNGSGKSNLVDAVAWVMGTQATRALRTEKMDDVVFAGTAIRASASRAEVSLTFDNESRGLPLDLAEVTVTRRLYRDGTSEYEINGTPCRLLDIQELLSDGGIGRHQHVIVGQGRVDAVLNAGPEEHRAVIEEAAGVIKHRHRRDRAIRRLESTEVDVQRLQDLLGEQQRRMRPLKRQANAAERYEQAKLEWRALRLWLGGERLRAIDARAAEIAADQKEIEQRIAEAETRLAEISTSLGGLQGAAGETGRSLERDTSAAARLETTAERLQRIAMVAGERRRALQGRLQAAGERRRDLESEQADLVEELRSAASEEEGLRAAAERHDMTLRSLEDEERSLGEQDQMPAEGVVASLRGDLAALEAAERRDRQEQTALQQRVAAVEARIEEEHAEADRLRDEIRAADEEAGPAQRAYDVAAAGRRETQQRLERAESLSGDAAVALAAARARIEALDGGAGAGPAADRAAGLDGVVGPAIARLDIPADLAAAVDAVLGGWGKALAVDDRAAARAAAAALIAGGDRGVALVAPGAPGPEGAMSDRLIDLLGPEADRPLAEALLGDVVLVESWEEGWDMVATQPGLRAVTRRGDLITTVGIILTDPAGGRAARQSARTAVERALVEEARANSSLTITRREFASSRERERESLERVEALEIRIAGATEALRLVERSRLASESDLSRLTARSVALDEAAESRTERLADLRNRLAGFEGEEAARQAAWEALARRRAAVTARRESVQQRHRDATASLAAIEERRRMLERRLGDVTELLAAPVDQPPDPDEVSRLEGVERRARTALDSTRHQLGELRERQRRLREEAGRVQGRLDDAQSARERLEPIVSEGREELSVLAVEAAELRVRREGEAEGLRRDVDVDEAAAFAAAAVEVPEGIDAADHLASLEAQVRRLGPVNPLAAAEYRELSERAEFLQEQLADLETSRHELRKVVSALDREISRLFLEAFEDIGGRFEETFALLFPGGRGRLSLTESDDPLETGVRVHAQPMGKKVGKLSLLSGGERSLAALAFLFAVFRARPSPFYVLDEVEAALDDANLRRFIGLVGTLRDSSQLVIVTHQQQTMEAADLLYGVTMEPGESSRILAKRLSRVEAGTGGAA